MSADRFFQPWVRGPPHNLAIVSEDVGVQDCDAMNRPISLLTYGELAKKVALVESTFKVLGIQRYSYVAVVLPASEPLVLVLLGLLNMGATYIPLSSHLRSLSHTVQTIKRLTHLRYIICGADLQEMLDSEFQYAHVEDLSEVLNGCRLIIRSSISEDHETHFEAHKIAYIIHTSGTTRKGAGGVPVRVPTKSIASNVRAIRSRLGITCKHPPVMVLASAPTFDPSLIEILLPLSAGGTIFIPLQSTLLDSEAFFGSLKRHSVTHLSITPSLLMRLEHSHRKMILDGKTYICAVILGGEPFPVALLQQSTAPNVSLWNIYGTTECSVWATLQQIKGDEVAIGEALDDTELEVRNVVEDVGELWIGGLQRISFVGDEVEGQTLRPTGDLVHVNSITGSIKYKGRQDNQIKISGYRVNLEVIAGVIDSVPGVVHSEVIHKKGSENEMGQNLSTGTLVAFVVLADAQMANEDAQLEAIRKELEICLPFYARPSDIRVLAAMPITPHGKADRQKLSQLLQYLDCPVPTVDASRACLLSDEQIMSHVVNTVAKRLPRAPSADECDWWFLAQGGTSIDATHAVEDLTTWLAEFDHDSTKSLEEFKQSLFTQILHHSVQNTAKGIAEYLHAPKKTGARLASGAADSSSQSMSQPQPVAFPRPAKRNRLEESVLVLHRAMDATSYDPKISRSSFSSDVMKTCWRVDLGKCVDASPVICVRSESDSEPVATAYIGSHAGIFAGIDVGSGEVMWKTQLGGRIESSACIVADASMVIVGCYDHKLYALSTQSGHVVATFETGAEVKCSPLSDPSSSLIWVGSHDRNIYCLDFSDSVKCVAQWNVGAPVFASCALDKQRRRIVACTLSGKILCFNTESRNLPTVAWSTQLQSKKPIFASPSVSARTGHIVISCVDEYAYCLCGDSGAEFWKTRFNGPIFSSPCVTDSLAFIACHDRSIKCLALPTGNLLWEESVETAGIYSSLFLTHHGLIVAAMDGWIGLLDPKNGQIKASCVIGDGKGVFSSPVSLNNCMVVGSRDDGVYGIALPVTRTMYESIRQ